MSFSFLSDDQDAADTSLVDEKKIRTDGIESDAALCFEPLSCTHDNQSMIITSTQDEMSPGSFGSPSANEAENKEISQVVRIFNSDLPVTNEAGLPAYL